MSGADPPGGMGEEASNKGPDDAELGGSVLPFHPFPNAKRRWSSAARGVLLSPAVVPHVAVFIDFFGLGIIIPLLPFHVEAQGSTSMWVGGIITGQYIGVVFGSAIFGKLSDRLGKQLVLRIIMALDVGLFILSGLVQTVGPLLLVRFLTGLSTPISAAQA